MATREPDRTADPRVSHASFKFPGAIALPEMGFRRPPHACRPLREVQSGEDLPDRLFLGDLERFGRDTDGWWANYRGEREDNTVDLRYDHADGLLCAIQEFHGVEGPPLGSTSFEGLLKAPVTMPLVWAKAIHDDLSSRFHIWTVDADEELFAEPYWERELADTWPTRHRWPDGIAGAVIVPVPVRHLQRAVDFARLADTRISPACAKATLHLEHRTVGYPKVDNKFPFDGHDDALLHNFTEMGVLLESELEWFTPPYCKGPRQLRVPRSHYSLHVEFFLRDLDAVTGALAECGLLAPRNDEALPSMEWPGGFEWSALLHFEDHCFTEEYPCANRSDSRLRRSVRFHCLAKSNALAHASLLEAAGQASGERDPWDAAIARAQRSTSDMGRWFYAEHRRVSD